MYRESESISAAQLASRTGGALRSRIGVRPKEPVPDNRFFLLVAARLVRPRLGFDIGCLFGTISIDCYGTMAERKVRKAPLDQRGLPRILHRPIHTKIVGIFYKFAWHYSYVGSRTRIGPGWTNLAGPWQSDDDDDGNAWHSSLGRPAASSRLPLPELRQSEETEAVRSSCKAKRYPGKWDDFDHHQSVPP